MMFLCVHPNYELYGSDRVFATAVESLEGFFGRAGLTVLLPRAGPIVCQPSFAGINIKIREMFILRRRGLLLRLLTKMPSYLRSLRSSLKEMNDNNFIYINTIIGIDFPIMARFSRNAVLIHVHEIPIGIELRFFRAILIWSKAPIMYNSEATQKAFAMPRGTREYVVHNGCKDPGQPTPPDTIMPRPLRILMIGRLNHWKGQETLISAVGLLTSPQDKVEVRVIGGTFNNQEDFRTGLQAQIDYLKLQDCIVIEPFKPDPSECYRWADVVVVPSRLPEPFGLVAIEAMAFGRPVIASRHGGLVEIVRHGETGLLFEPSCAADLASALKTLMDHPTLIAAYGAAGRSRFCEHFSEEKFRKEFLSVIQTELRLSGNIA